MVVAALATFYGVIGIMSRNISLTASAAAIAVFAVLVFFHATVGAIFFVL